MVLCVGEGSQAIPLGLDIERTKQLGATESADFSCLYIIRASI